MLMLMHLTVGDIPMHSKVSYQRIHGVKVESLWMYRCVAYLKKDEKAIQREIVPVPRAKPKSSEANIQLLPE